MRRVYPDLTRTRLLAVLHYEASESDPWTWKVRTGYRIRIGDKAGCIAHVGKDGVPCRIIGIDNQGYRSSHLAWFYMTGEWPPAGMEVDHKNGDSLDDSWKNLRLGTRAQQLINRRVRRDSKSGIKWVRLHKRGLWQGRVGHTSVGYFKSPVDCFKACLMEAQQKAGQWLPTAVRLGMIPEFNYDELYYLQKGRCAFCGDEEHVSQNGKRNPLVACHDPDTGNVMGLLCQTRCVRLFRQHNGNRDLMLEALKVVMKYDIPIKSAEHAEFCKKEAVRRYGVRLIKDHFRMWLVEDENGFTHTDDVLRALSRWDWEKEDAA